LNKFSLLTIGKPIDIISDRKRGFERVFAAPQYVTFCNIDILYGVMDNMGGKVKKMLALFGAVALIIAVWNRGPAFVAAADADCVAEALTGAGLDASVSGGTVTVTGFKTDADRLVIDISGVVVNWNATFSGAATANNYLLTLSGNGTFNMQGGVIDNTTGAGGAVYINGPVTLNVTGGVIDAPGAGSAVTVRGVDAGVRGAAINVNGGTVRSVPNGYAINDGAGMTASENDTKINVISGLVEAGSACAIRSTGKDSVVTISGGEVRNAAASNTNSTIYMNYAPPPAGSTLNNIVVSGGTVRTTNTGNQSYVLQTSQNVYISGGTVESINGRTINLVGMNSTATVTGGRVITENGTAISTATTTLDDVTNAKVVITGGIVEATGQTGDAVRITGYNSTVSISGGALVLAKGGYAVNASGRPASGSVYVSGGFVFCWKNSSGKVAVYPAAKLNAVGGTVATWNTTTGSRLSPPYEQGKDADLEVAYGKASWQQHSYSPETGRDGISYGDSNTFFELNVNVFITKYELTVINGTIRHTGGIAGDKGSFGAGERVNIAPLSSIPERNTFKKWETTNTLTKEPVMPTFADSSRALEGFTVLIMPPFDLTVEAIYEVFTEDPKYTVAIIGGKIMQTTVEGTPILGGGAGVTAYDVFPGTGLYIQAGTPPPGQEFLRWEVKLTGSGGDFESWSAFTGESGFKYPTAPHTIFSMLDSKNVTIKAVYGPIQPKYYLTVRDGSPAYSGPYFAGDKVTITASTPAGKVFGGWSSDKGGDFANPYAASTAFTMPDNDVTVRAVFEFYDDFTLEVKNGTDDSIDASGGVSRREKHHVDEKVTVVADPPPAGKEFDRWVTHSGGGFDDARNPTTGFKMPARNAVIEATYRYIGEDVASGAGYSPPGGEAGILYDLPIRNKEKTAAAVIAILFVPCAVLLSARLRRRSRPRSQRRVKR
jgi:hypothetical protein